MSAWVLPDQIADVLPSEARHIEELRRSLLDTASGYGYELVMPPLLEHLESPAEAVDCLASVCGQHLLVSVPREPIWRAMNMARGKYLLDLGNTPGHVQYWSRAGFLALLQRRFDIVAMRSPLPWTMALCRPRAT